jgi:two-component system, sensor histidine kinase and response regulator
LNFSPVDLSVLATEVVEELSPIAIDKGLILKVGSAPTLPLLVKGDRLELHRVITNLVGNAVKFTDKGSVILDLAMDERSLKSANRQGAVVMLAVQDTGSGIPPEEHAMLFESFTQGKHKRAGSGLGLHLTRRIAEAHAGEIRVQSKVGEGSTFTVLLPSY